MNIYFDFDGTLADTGPALVEAVRLSFLAQDLPPPASSEIIPLMGFPLPEILGIMRGKEANSQEILDFRELVEHYYQAMAIEEICLFPGIAALLEEFSHKADSLAILTNKPMKCVVNEAKFLKIAPYFKAIVGADLAGAPKPMTHILEMAHLMMDFSEEKKQESLKNSLMVGDSTADIGMAQRAGIKSIGVTWGAQDAQTLKNEGADHIAETVPELREILESYF